MATVFGLIGGLVSAVGTIASSGAMRSQADAERQAAAYNAQLLNQRAQQDQAAAQRKMMDEQKKGQYAQSKLQAAAAASGGGADDPTIIKLGADIAGQSEYNALNELWTGQAQAVDLQNEGQLDIYQGDMEATALDSRADATLLGGFGGLFGQLGKDKTLFSGLNFG